MSHFIVSFNTDYTKEVVEAIKAISGVKLVSRPGIDGTLRIQTITRHLDDEANAVHAVEDVFGVLDVRLLEK